MINVTEEYWRSAEYLSTCSLLRLLGQLSPVVRHTVIYGADVELYVQRMKEKYGNKKE